MKRTSGIKWLKTMRKISLHVVFSHIAFFVLATKFFSKTEVIKYSTGFLLPSFLVTLMALILLHLLIKMRENMTAPRGRGKRKGPYPAYGRPTARWEVR